MSNQLSLFTAPELLASAFRVPGVLILAVNDDGSVSVNSHGLNHRGALDALTIGIHAVMCQHDEMVAKGMAGEAARDLFERLGEMT
jgi:hypothetical protein